MLYERKQVYEKLKDDRRALYEHPHKRETDFRNEFDWMAEGDSQAQKLTRMDLDLAYQQFFKSLSGKRKGKSGFPKFKKKRHGGSYTTDRGGVSKEGRLKLPKLGTSIKIDDDREIKGDIRRITISKTPTGKWFASILTQQELILKGIEISDELKTKVIGLDMSLSNFFVDQNGNSPAYERLYRNSEKKLKRAQRKMSRKKKGSNNFQKQRVRIALIHEKISNKRRDFTQKLSTQLVRENEVIVIEHLSLKAMSGALKLGKSVMDLGYSAFIHQLQYKCLWNNKILVQADKWFASSKTCSICGQINKNLTLSDRSWVCPNCGIEHDRDQNAGQNLVNYGLKEIGLHQPEFTPMEFMASEVSSGTLSQDVEVGSTVKSLV